MKVEDQAAARRVKPPGTSVRRSPSAQRNWTSSDLVASMLARCEDGTPRFAARLPGRLDVMGGSAEYTGSLVLGAALNEHALAVVQRRSDKMVRVTALAASEDGEEQSLAVEARHLCNGAGASVALRDGTDSSDISQARLSRGVLGTLAGMARAKVLPDFSDGLAVITAFTSDGLRDVGREAALGAAVASAAAAAMKVAFEPADAIAAFEVPDPSWDPVPVSAAEILGALCAEPGALSQVRTDPCAFAGAVALPKDLMLLGVHCGVVHAHVGTKYELARTSAFMGRTLIDCIVRHDGITDVPWDGYLSRISAADYVDRFRDRIPTKMAGSQFLERFGDTPDPLSEVKADVVYKVRSRTEHHIYEHARAWQFVQCLTRANRNADAHALADAGELMYASHWSYGQRCGLGSVETDLLVTLIRRHGADAGIYGAKITGRGCGGVVAVLMRVAKPAEAALERALADYRAKTKLEPTVLRGSRADSTAPGAVQL